MPPKVTPKSVPKKPGTIGGIPKWGWIAGAAIGLLIGYMLIRSSSASGSPAPAGSGGVTPADPVAAASDQQASGNIPWDEIIKALGLRGGGTGTVAQTSTDTPTSQTTAAQAAIAPGPIVGDFTTPQTGDTPPSPYVNMGGGDYFNPVYTPTVDSPSSMLAGTSSFHTAFGSQVTTTGTIAAPGSDSTFTPNIDPSGHVVNAKGARVGGVADPV